MATSVITSKPSSIPPVSPDFGWYFGTTPTRMTELTYQVGTNHYPPALTSLSGAVTFTPGGGSFTLGVNSPNTSVFETFGRLMVQDQSTYHFAIVNYTGITTSTGLTTSFTGATTLSTSTGSPLALAAKTPVFDRRYYFDQAPLNTLITFDTLDADNLGLPTTSCPPGISIRQYQWDLGNGEIAYGPQAGVTYNFSQPPPINVTLTVTDTLGREYSVAHPITLSTQTALYARAIPDRGGQ